jgi:hypothetical protein
VLRSGWLQPYLPTIDEAGKACQGQTLQLITAIKSFIVQAPGGSGAIVIKNFMSVTYKYW